MTGRGRVAVLGFTLAIAASASGQGRRLPDRVVVERSSLSGQAMLVTAADGGALPLSTRGGAAQVEPMDFLIEYGSVFGVSQPGEQLRVQKAQTDALGSRHTTYQQMHQGMRVFSGELRVHQDAAGGVTAANGRFYRNLDKVNTVPVISAQAALDYAAAVMPGVNQPAGEPELVIVDPGWYGDAPRGPHLAYYLTLKGADDRSAEAFFVSAATGDVLDHWSSVCTLQYREIYDANGIDGRAEGEPPSTGHPDINRAYDYLGDVYGYYWRGFGRDSIDDQGMPMVALVHLQNCRNAFWAGFPDYIMVFCTGMVVDDIGAHELTHGVTEFTADLIYQNQPGQLNEAFSDIFGELVDLFNGNAAFVGEPGGGAAWPAHPTGPGTDAPNNRRTGCSYSGNNYADGVRWLGGEDTGEVIRDMWSPSCLGNPDNVNSILNRCQPYDNGGVHVGSGILAHAFAMATDGKTYNGYTITGVGPIKSGAVFYRALTQYLVAVSDFEDTYYLLNRAAQDLIGTTPLDPRTGQPSASLFTADDALQIDKALLAVGLNTPGRCGMQPLLDADAPPVCSNRVVIYADNFENGANGWQTVNETPLPGADNWKQVSNLQDGRPGRAWFVSDPDIECDGSGATGTRRLLSPPIALPADAAFPSLRFTHLVQSESFWDGGNVRIKVNNGGWQLIPADAFVFNPYNLMSLYSDIDNPLAGQPAFSGWGGQWGTSVVDLRAFASAGDQVQVRFDFGTDYCYGLVGWYIDDFEIYDCPQGTDCNENGIPDSLEMANGPQPDMLLDQPMTYSAFVTLGQGSGGPGDNLNFAEAYAEDFYLPQPKEISVVRIWGGFDGTVAGGNDLRVRIHESNATGMPGAVVASDPFDVIATWTPMNVSHSGVTIWQIDLRITIPIALSAGSYFVEVYRSTPTLGKFYWEVGNYAPDTAWYAYSTVAPGQNWRHSNDPDALRYPTNLGMQLFGRVLGEDCNHNGVPDECDAFGADSDCNSNGIPDACEPANDCNSNGISDLCEADCNHNGYADECDIAGATSTDCNANGAPDDCEAHSDCNANGISDLCDVLQGGAADCDHNLLPDSCQSDTDSDHTIDACDECPTDPQKGTAGKCGCGKSEADADGDGVPNCIDVCTNGNDKIDTDKDGVPDCADECPKDKNETKAGQCGCGTPEYDPDDDGVATCVDNCPMHANAEQVNTDGDGLGDMCDGCPGDAAKTAPGVCGCGSVDLDSDGDGLYDCADPCPQNPTTDNTDSDADGAGDACEECPLDPNKTLPGVCGCGRSDTDGDGDGVPNCIDTCSGTPAGTVVDASGCPVNQSPPPQPTPGPDADGDGVADDVDECADTPADTTVDDVGCPVTGTPDPGDGTSDPACGTMGAVSMILLGLGLVGMRQRLR